MKGKYLYGIIGKTKNTSDGDPKGLLRGGRIATVDFRRLSAVITETEFKDYQSLAKKEVIKELTRHQQVIERIMEQFPVLPVKFGTILKNDKEVNSVLKKGYFFLRDTLQQTEDKIELDLVCFWNEEKAAQMAFKEDKRVQKMQADLIKKKGKTALEDKIALGKAVANYLAVKKTAISSQILRVLKKEVVKRCSHALAEVNILLNQAFLVKKQNEERFNHTLNKLDSKFSHLVNFRLVGPLPPYSFATVVIDALNKEEIEKAKKLLNLNGSTESTLSKAEGLTTGGELKKEKIKKAYDQLALKLHPDHGGDPIKFERVTKSYKLLRKYAKQGLMAVYLYQWEHENPNLHSDYPYGS